MHEQPKAKFRRNATHAPYQSINISNLVRLPIYEGKALDTRLQDFIFS